MGGGGEGGVFQMGGFIFKCVCVCVGGGVPMGDISFGGKGGFEKNCKMGAAPHVPTMGKSEKNLS